MKKSPQGENGRVNWDLMTFEIHSEPTQNGMHTHKRKINIVTHIYIYTSYIYTHIIYIYIYIMHVDIYTSVHFLLDPVAISSSGILIKNVLNLILIKAH